MFPYCWIYIEEMSQQKCLLSSDVADGGSPVRQRLQDGGHQHPRNGLVEDGVTHTDNVDHGGGAQDRQHVWRHPLPEVQQEALHLNAPQDRDTTLQKTVDSNDTSCPLQAWTNYDPDVISQHF